MAQTMARPSGHWDRNLLLMDCQDLGAEPLVREKKERKFKKDSRERKIPVRIT